MCVYRTHKQPERNYLEAQIKIYLALFVDFTAAHIIEISRWDRKKQLLSWYEIVLLQALFHLFLGGEKVHSNTAGFRIWRVFHFPCYTGKWNHVFFWSADCMLIAEVGRGRGIAMCSPPFVTNVSPSSKRRRKVKARQKIDFCLIWSVPFLGSGWRSWNVRRRTHLLEPGGRSSAPPLLPYGEPEGGHVCHPLLTWHFNWPEVTQRQKSTRDDPSMNEPDGALRKQRNKIVTCDRADRIGAFPSTQGETRQVWAAMNTGER